MCFPLEPVFTRDKRRLPNFIDEPTSALDVMSKERVMDYLQDIKQDKIIIIISHDWEIAELCDKVIKIGICDDDKNFRTLLAEAIRREDSESFIYEYSTGETLIQDEENDLDLLFLDIQLPGISGNKASEIMKKKNKDLILVFVSGIYLPTPESFCVQPYRYLLKQSNPSEIQRELGTILTYTKEHKGKKYFIVEDDGMYQKIDIDEILYFSIIRRGCEIHILQNGTGKILRTRKRIQEIEEELRREYFCRIHKSFLVNPRYITEVKKSEIKMDNNEILSVSKAKRKTFEDMFAEYLSYRK